MQMLHSIELVSSSPLALICVVQSFSVAAKRYMPVVRRACIADEDDVGIVGPDAPKDMICAGIEADKVDADGRAEFSSDMVR